MEGWGGVSMAVLGFGVKVVLREDGINEVDRESIRVLKLQKRRALVKV